MPPATFQTDMGPDRIIRVPKEIHVDPGPIEVTVLPLAKKQPEPSSAHLFDRLGRLAAAHDTSNLPQDLAKNHDHYLHGLPKRTDDHD